MLVSKCYLLRKFVSSTCKHSVNLCVSLHCEHVCVCMFVSVNSIYAMSLCAGVNCRYVTLNLFICIMCVIECLCEYVSVEQTCQV